MGLWGAPSRSQTSGCLAHRKSNSGMPWPKLSSLGVRMQTSKRKLVQKSPLPDPGPGYSASRCNVDGREAVRVRAAHGVKPRVSPRLGAYFLYAVNEDYSVYVLSGIDSEIPILKRLSASLAAERTTREELRLQRVYSEDSRPYDRYSAKEVAGIFRAVSAGLHVRVLRTTWDNTFR